MRDSVFWLLVLSVVISAMITIYARHQHRINYVALQLEMKNRDAFNVEWGQLLIEESLWSFPHRVEKDATETLSMKMPSEKDIVLVEN